MIAALIFLIHLGISLAAGFLILAAIEEHRARENVRRRLRAIAERAARLGF